MKQSVVALCAGLLFGLGLCISEMADPNKVLAFLDITQNWDPSLLFVMGGALMVTFVSFRWILKRSEPLICDQFYLPDSNRIDNKLIAGAVIFGVGWGLIGYCPGPAITALGFITSEPWLVVISIIMGSFLSDLSMKWLRD